MGVNVFKIKSLELIFFFLRKLMDNLFVKYFYYQDGFYLNFYDIF